MKSLFKKLLPNTIVNVISQRLQTTKQFLSKLMGRFRVTSALYYFIFDHQYYREQQATLAGKNSYAKQAGIAGSSSALLRRNTHRLEKGLIMQPRKPIFAEGYIGETVACYQRCVSGGNIESRELIWAQDVLVAYFAAVDIEQSKVIQNAHQVFSRLPIISEQNSHAIPYAFEKRVNSEITSKSLYDLFKQRRSVRWFEPRKVAPELIEQAVEMALQAPSACNRQPFEFYTFYTPEKASKIAAIPMGTKGFAENIQALIVIVGDLSAYPKERDRHVIYIDGGLVAMQLMLACESLGLSTCPINWPDMEMYEKKMEKELALEKHQRPIMLMAIGYGKPTGKIPFSQKKSAQQVIKEMD
ncbi:nitroreductase family protein [Thalassotalea sediminis]|uniref:nitroreductase family protein n=1 Tax=Thalassotalea sediminis TaxID=1759089 RepID=UPI002573C7EB|nr:nitroreductase family protein [Thalassotalea sediminis]